MTAHPFSGLTVALATPFTSDGSLDRSALRRLVRHVVAGGVDQLLVLGSTGEAPLLAPDERDRVVATCLESAEGRAVLVGTGHSATRQAVEWTQRARRLGAHGALVAVPPYVKPEATGVLAHFAALADAVPDLPLVAYNVPGRTGRNLPPDAVEALWQIPAVVAIKDSSGDLAQTVRLTQSLPAGRSLLCGDDHLALPAIAAGAQGLVSVVANLFPAAAADLVRAARRGDLGRARARVRQLLPLMEALFVESNPIPLKAALLALELADDRTRLPLTPATSSTRRFVQAAIEEARSRAVS